MTGKVPRGEKKLLSGTDPESYITEDTFVQEYKNGKYPFCNKPSFHNFKKSCFKLLFLGTLNLIQACHRSIDISLPSEFPTAEECGGRIPALT